MATTTEDLLKQALEQNRKLMKQVQTLTEQVAYLNRKLYGSHSEKMTDPNQLSLLGGNSVFTDPEQTGQQSEEIVVVKAKRKPKSSRGESIDPKLPIEETVITRESELCDHGHQLTKVGKHLVREVVHHIPGRLYVERLFEETYKCPECELEDGVSHLYQGQAPQALFPHSLATSSLVAELLYQKYALGTPLYRQILEWRRAGLLLSETTMTNWVINAAEIVRPVYDLMHEYLLSERFLQGDETPFQVLREPGKSAKSKSYIWVERSIRLADQQVVYYAYGNTRSGKFAQRIYSGYTGVLQCDGYAGYNLLGDSVIRVGCWAHVRRKFYDDAAKVKGKFTSTKPLELLNQMFHLETQWALLSPAERLKCRLAKLKPLIDQFWAWCDQAAPAPKSRLGIALTYALNQRRMLNRVLEFGEIDLSNNASERNMKSFVIGRKNWLFATSPKGAEANTIWMTIVETAKANGLDPRIYIEHLLQEMSQLSASPTREQAEAYLPWNQHLKPATSETA
ncbi:IS66 family transposase [Lactiplantibacillus xiangfangensis]|uniref:IS66 family transposase n=1 Tax=Lactiplantibacillus xiangfangensis TaxID=942150 RepID=UPI00384C0482